MSPDVVITTGSQPRLDLLCDEQSSTDLAEAAAAAVWRDARTHVNQTTSTA